MKRYIAILLLICMLISMAGCTVVVDEEELKEALGQIAQEVGDELAQQASEALDNAMEDLEQKAQEELDKAAQSAQDIFKDTLDKMQGNGKDPSNIWDDEFAGLPGEGGLNMPVTGPEGYEGKLSMSGEPYIDPADLDRSKAWYEGIGSGRDEPYYYIFYANGGSNAPEPQKCFYESEKITKETPVRPGYHFMGWAPAPCGEDGRYTELYWFAGEKPQGKLPADVEMYAVWGKHTNPLEARTDYTFSAALWLDHEYKVKRDGNDVTIFCSCGMEVADRSISRSEFMYYVFNEKVEFNALSVDREKYQKQYILYRAREIGPVALELVGSYYQDPKDGGALARFMDQVKNLAKATKYASTALKALSARKLKTMDEKIVVNEVFDKISGTAKQVSTAVSICKAGYYFVELLNTSPTDSGAQAAINLVNTVESVIVLAPGGKFVKPLAKTLKEGLKLFAKVDQYEAEYAARLETIPLKNRNVPYLDYVLGKDAFLVMENYEKGCTCGKDEGTCPCEGDPSVHDVLLRIQELEESKKIVATEEEQFLVGMYLAERISHEFYAIAGTTIEAYADMVK